MNVTFRPLVVWPGQSTLNRNRRTTPFQAPIAATWHLLEREVELVGGREIVVQLAVDETQIRLDGRPRAGAQPRHPGVIVSFDSRYGPLQYATDVFTDWHANLRAIALGLEALRKVDRYGISKRGEQYTGWKALPTGNGQRPFTSLEEAAAFIGGYAGCSTASLLDADSSILQIAYRRAARELHPDTGGDAALFARLQDAKQLLEGAPR